MVLPLEVLPVVHILTVLLAGAIGFYLFAQVRAVRLRSGLLKGKAQPPGAGARRSVRNREIETPTVRGLGRHSHVHRGFI